MESGIACSDLRGTIILGEDCSRDDVLSVSDSRSVGDGEGVSK